jgi:Icc-related predicted phosphoesterase
MGLLRRTSNKVTLFFATDIHGSEICFKKFLGAPDFYGADVSILGGDMTGKMIVPLVADGSRGYEATVAGRPVSVDDEDAARALEARIRDAGFYPYRTDPDEIAELGRRPERVDELFRAEMAATLRRWGELAEARYEGTDRVVYVAPGNDDPTRSTTSSPRCRASG